MQQNFNGLKEGNKVTPIGAGRAGIPGGKPRVCGPWPWRRERKAMSVSYAENNIQKIDPLPSTSF